MGRRRAVVVIARHGRRDTNAYPPTPNTTGIIINMPNTVLNIEFSIPVSPLLSGAGPVPRCGDPGYPEFNDDVRRRPQSTPSSIGRSLGPGRCMCSAVRFDGLVNPNGA